MEKEAGRKTGKERRRKEQSRNMEEEVGENENEIMKERIKALDDRITEGKKFSGNKEKIN
jgi:hypothetical protein